METIYGNRFFETDPPAGGNPPVPADDDTKAKLERLAHLEKENKDLIAQRDKAKDAKRKEEEDKLKQQGELQKLLDAKEIEVIQLKTKADAFEELRTTEIDEAKKALGDKWLDEYANLSLIALRKTVQLFAVNKKVPGVDDGHIPPPSTVTLTEQQKREAYEKFPYLSKEKAEESWFEVLVKTGKIKKG